MRIRAVRTVLIAACVIVCSPVVQAQEGGPPRVVESIEIDTVPSWFPVGFSLLTHEGMQYVAYYNADHEMVAASRKLDEKTFRRVKLPQKVGWDSHNGITLAVDDNGCVHLAGNMHCVPLIYFRMKTAGDIGTFERVAMTGVEEERCTYPQFLRDLEGRLIFNYRSGGSGNGKRLYNRYDPKTETWSRLLDSPLLDGEGERNAYPQGPVLGPDRRFHVVWVWRDTPDCATNHHLSYARSKDLIHWEAAAGKAVEVPLTLGQDELCIDPIPSGGGIINGCERLAFDSSGRPMVSYHKSDADGHMQIWVARFEDGEWVARAITEWAKPVPFSGRGAMGFIGIRISGLQRSDADTWFLTYRHRDYGSGRIVLDDETLAVVDRPVVAARLPPEVSRREIGFDGVSVRTAADLGDSGQVGVRYLLKWETLPPNQDRPRTGKLPPPAQLKLFKIVTSSSAVAPAQSGEALQASFESPPLTARPMVLWPWLNGYVDRAQMTRELEEMRAKGLRGPIIWDIGSLADPDKTIPVGPPFLSEDSIASIHFAIAEAARLGLEVGLVASSSWNAGGAWIEPEHASKQLRWAAREVSGPAGFAGPLPVPEDITEPHVEVALLALPAVDESETQRPIEPVNLAARVDRNGRLDWEIPDGRWTILRFVCCGTGQPLVCPSPGSNGLVVDHLSRAATDRHFGVMFDRLFRGGKNLGAFKLMMLDSFEVWPRVDWTPGFAREFEDTFGYDVLPYLPVLAGRETHAPDVRERFLHDYRSLVSRMMVANHFGRAAELLQQRGLELLAEAGHGGYPRVGALEALGVSHIPMGEFWNGKQFWVTKEAASAAHTYGRRDVAAEALTGWRHWRDGPEEYKRLFDIAFCAGLNRPVFHTFAHNPPRAGKPGFAYHAGEHFNVNSTWWEQAGPMLQYLSRCSHMLRQGRFVGDVCFYYGDQAPNIVPSRRIDPKMAPPHNEGECQHCGRPMPNRVGGLGPGYDYDYVDRDIVVGDMRTQNGRLTLSSGMEYRLIALADREDIALPVLRRLEELVREGAALVGRRPTRSNSLQGYPDCDAEVRRLARLLWGEGDTAPHRHGRGRVYRAGVRPLRGILQEMGVRPDFVVETPTGHDLDYIHRRTASEDIYFVVNSSDLPVHAECSFRVAPNSRPSLWNPEDGSIVRCSTYRIEDGATRVPLHLPPVSSVFVVFRAEAETDHVVDLGPSGRTAPRLVDRDVEVLAVGPTHLRVRARAAGTFSFATARGRSAEVEIAAPPADLVPSGPWQLEFPAARGAPTLLELDELQSWTDLQPEAARYFAGTARYTAELTVPAAYIDERHALWLDLGSVAEIAEVSINGAPVGVLWKAPYRTDVTRLLKPGGNSLEAKVTNLWHNRIVGDLRSPEAEARAATNLRNRFKADMELLPSGLLGPVVLRPVVEVEVPLR